jgi:hypothetical protein
LPPLYVLLLLLQLLQAWCIALASTSFARGVPSRTMADSL